MTDCFRRHGFPERINAIGGRVLDRFPKRDGQGKLHLSIYGCDKRGYPKLNKV